MTRTLLIGFALAIVLSACTGMACNAPGSNYTYEVVATYPHDSEAFTQGLAYEDGALYEGTGLRGKSSLRRVALETGEVLQQHDLNSAYFGEGVAVVDDRIIQLTWTSGKGFVYDKASFELLDEFSYSGQGWGLTYDGERLIMSDGSGTLRFLDPITFEQTGTVMVFDGLKSIQNLNELEYISGEVYANVWQTDTILRIDPEAGQVVGRIDLSGLLDQCAEGADDATKQAAPNVLNGIAYDPENDRLFVTGKLWPCLFEIRLIPQQSE